MKMMIMTHENTRNTLSQGWFIFFLKEFSVREIPVDVMLQQQKNFIAVNL